MKQHEKEERAKEIKEFLHKAKKQVEHCREQGCLSQEQLRALEKEYGKIIIRGIEYHLSLPPLESKRKGKRKQRVGKNLLDRLAGNSDTNNQGERHQNGEIKTKDFRLFSYF